MTGAVATTGWTRASGEKPTIHNRPSPARGAEYMAWRRAMIRQGERPNEEPVELVPTHHGRKDLLAAFMKIKDRRLRCAVACIAMWDRWDIVWGDAFDGYVAAWTHYRDRDAIAAELVKLGYPEKLALKRAKEKTY